LGPKQRRRRRESQKAKKKRTLWHSVAKGLRGRPGQKQKPHTNCKKKNIKPKTTPPAGDVLCDRKNISLAPGCNDRRDANFHIGVRKGKVEYQKEKKLSSWFSAQLIWLTISKKKGGVARTLPLPEKWK